MIIFFFIFSDRLFTFLKSRQAKNAICDIFSLEWGFSYGRGHVKKGTLLYKATFKWATSMSHKSPNWTPGIQHLWYQYIIIISINISTLYVSTWKTFKSKYSKTLMHNFLIPNKLNILVYTVHPPCVGWVVNWSLLSLFNIKKWPLYCPQGSGTLR